MKKKKKERNKPKPKQKCKSQPLTPNAKEGKRQSPDKRMREITSDNFSEDKTPSGFYQAAITIKILEISPQMEIPRCFSLVKLLLAGETRRKARK